MTTTLLTPCALAATVLLAGCNGKLDDGWGGLSAGGDVRLLQEAGAACVGFDPDASGPAAPWCDAGLGNADPCATRGSRPSSPWFALHHALRGPRVVPDGGEEQSCMLAEYPARCNEGDDGDRYCQAWAAQFYTEPGLAAWKCEHQLVPNPVIIEDVVLCAQTADCPGVSGGCVEPKSCVESAPGRYECRDMCR